MKSSTTGKSYKLPTESLSLIEDYWTDKTNQNVIAEFSGTGLISKSYLWGLDLSGSMQGAGGVGGLLSIEQHLGDGASRHYVAYDGNGNVVGLADADTGEMSASYEYSAFGEVLQMEGEYAVKNDYRFSTKPQEGMTGLYYYGYRWLDAGTGRWLSRDPIGERGGVNLYGFVGNDGVNYVDRLGLIEAELGGAITGDLIIPMPFGFGASISVAETYRFVAGWPPKVQQCFTVTISVHVGSVGAATVSVGLAGGFGKTGSGAPGGSASTGVGFNVATPEGGGSGSLAIYDDGSGVAAGGSRGNLSIGLAGFAGVSRNYHGRACQSILKCLKPFSQYWDRPRLLKEAADIALREFEKGSG